MSGHVCELPAVDHRTAWHCMKCGWDWRVNPVVKRWFRDVPPGG